MSKATFRFYEELNDFLPRHRRKTDFEAEFTARRSIKDMIEALGVPHTEIDLILANGKSVDFKYILKDGNRISVYPVFESLESEKVTHKQKKPLRRTRFIADFNLGNIVRYMRVLGFDIYSDSSLTRDKIIELSKKENRIILTTSRTPLKFKDISHGIFLRPGSVEEQIRYVMDYLDIKDKVKPFSRCLRCNEKLTSIPIEGISDRIPPGTKSFCNEYTYCETCDKIFWRGSHVDEMQKVVERILCKDARKNNLYRKWHKFRLNR